MRILSIAIGATIIVAPAWAGQEVADTKVWDEWVRGLVSVLLGAGIAFLAVIIHDFRRRNAEARDVAGALYQEIADRAARCCLDFYKSWQGHLIDPNAQTGKKRFCLKRLLKFRPADPVVYPDLGIKMALLKPGVASPVIHFYFRLDAWRRDIDHWRDRDGSDYFSNTEFLAPEDCRLLAKRLGETLSPALDALAALESAVPGHAQLDQRAKDSYKIEGGDLRKALQDMATIASSVD